MKHLIFISSFVFLFVVLSPSAKGTFDCYGNVSGYVNQKPPYALSIKSMEEADIVVPMLFRIDDNRYDIPLACGLWEVTVYKGEGTIFTPVVFEVLAGGVTVVDFGMYRLHTPFVGSDFNVSETD